MGLTLLKGKQIKDFTVVRSKMALDFLGGVDWDLTNGAKNATIRGLADAVALDSPATLNQLNNAIAGLQGMTYKGVFNASIPSPDLAAIASKQGDFYKVSVAGTYLGISLLVGDMIIINKDVAVGAITAADIDKIDNTESANLLHTTDVVDNLLSNSATLPLSANQGFVLKGLIDALSANVKNRKYSEILVPTAGSGVLPALANPPVAGTVRVYMNGERQLEGASNDYTIAGSVITFNYGLEADELIVVDYEY